MGNDFEEGNQMTYQRGTDLKHCPDGCEHLDITEPDWSMDYTIECTARQSDTCPREQAEKPAETCATCQYFEFTSLMCLRYPVATETRGYRTCGEWKERTND